MFPQVETRSARLLLLILKTKVVYALLVVSLLMQKGTKPVNFQIWSLQSIQPCPTSFSLVQSHNLRRTVRVVISRTSRLANA